MLERITKIAAKYYFIKYEETFLKCRARRYVQARQMISYIAYVDYHYTFHRIGTFLKKDHATIIHGVKAVKGELEVSKGLQKEYDEIKELLRKENSEVKYITPASSKMCHPITYGTAV